MTDPSSNPAVSIVFDARRRAPSKNYVHRGRRGNASKVPKQATFVAARSTNFGQKSDHSSLSSMQPCKDPIPSRIRRLSLYEATHQLLLFWRDVHASIPMQVALEFSDGRVLVHVLNLAFSSHRAHAQAHCGRARALLSRSSSDGWFTSSKWTRERSCRRRFLRRRREYFLAPGSTVLTHATRTRVTSEVRRGRRCIWIRTADGLLVKGSASPRRRKWEVEVKEPLPVSSPHRWRMM